jgi:hypothetical protein
MSMAPNEFKKKWERCGIARAAKRRHAYDFAEGSLATSRSDTVSPSNW